jgi:hypothetical protein
VIKGDVLYVKDFTHGNSLLSGLMAILVAQYPSLIGGVWEQSWSSPEDPGRHNTCRVRYAGSSRRIPFAWILSSL